MSEEPVQLTIERGIALATLNRPQVLNALNHALMERLATTLEACDRDAEVRCIVVWGGPRVFAAGADVREMAGAAIADVMQAYRFEQWARIRRVAKPIVAAVTGYALGGGCELAMLCDIVIAAETAQFGQPEIRLGLMPGAGGTQRLTRAVGKSRAMELVLTGRALGAHEAHAAGLVSQVVPAEVCLDEAMRLAAEIARQAPVAVRLAKEAVLQAFETPLEAGLAFERRSFHALFGTDDMREGVRAFLEKRRPEFRGT
ncbi:MAG TPA: enoyl-CoA hydratase-related protein [bacterium]|nr:enoyl-CoA hydratase-related protein [bacterium]